MKLVSFFNFIVHLYSTHLTSRIRWVRPTESRLSVLIAMITRKDIFYVRQQLLFEIKFFLLCPLCKSYSGGEETSDFRLKELTKVSMQNNVTYSFLV